MAQAMRPAQGGGTHIRKQLFQVILESAFDLLALD
jgi:hypothetical protein